MRLNTLGDALTDVAKHRHVQPAELCRIVRGDLDWVVMKAMEKDRTRRYETANELARISSGISAMSRFRPVPRA